MAICIKCLRDEELRLGFCWECATQGEAGAARRTVLQHVLVAAEHWHPADWWKARHDLNWAWERLTRTGDYRPGGEFEREYGIRLRA